ncbi:hypothetical protein OB955_17630 [Halobacteria archaeon AArc-m2/3/4]|uniref:Uncharacterized protein n=1 Tax=Natronoglomus mannanivorans TaxID=2979990 RepID=A0AAP3E293_9EURY|nr:hypothetical protein [Halobacteria archaeon AArc-xg1-1]MCU4974544.1 hypothetical protein [Halobacteria archaeon AArc-m2/3/4]
MERRRVLRAITGAGVVGLAGCLGDRGDNGGSRLDRYTPVDGGTPPTATPEPTPIEVVDFELVETDDGRLGVDLITENTGSELEDATLTVFVRAGDETDEPSIRLSLEAGETSEDRVVSGIAYEEFSGDGSISVEIVRT